MKQQNSIKIPPYNYIHILDRNTNVTRVEIGPSTFIRQDHEFVQTGDKPNKMIILPERHYCVIENPIIMEKGKPVQDKYGQYQVQLGEIEIRFQKDYARPFLLYPNEVLVKAPTELRVIKEMTALKIEALRNCVDSNGVKRMAGDQYLYKGPATYYPKIEEEILSEVNSIVIGECSALKLRAKYELTDTYGNLRKSGEEWLIREAGAYLPEVYEEVVKIIDPIILDDQKALHLVAAKTFVDVYGNERKAGEEYLITNEMASYHIIDIHEELKKECQITVLDSLQYCVVVNPIDPETNKNKQGAKLLIRGPKSFFLQPGEELDHGIQNAFLLGENQALLLKASEKVEVNGEVQEPGNKWMIHGPCSYVPPVEVDVVELREKIALDKNEAIYVRDTRTGKINVIKGVSYMLQSHEELWEMELPEQVEKLLVSSYFHTNNKRIKHRVVSYRAPFNTAVQVYDFKAQKSRIVFGPDLVTLNPDEVFTQVALSGGTPKKPGTVHTLAVKLGPEFSSDEIQVETSDHAVLRLLLAYNWHFRVFKDNEEENLKIFNVKDFIGDMCNLMASKVRSAVASVDFDTFHKTSARLIRRSIFGLTEQNKIGKEFIMEKNNLVITNVDIKQVEPIDNQTKLSLQKTVQLAIEISTKKQEAAATHLAEQSEQKAIGEIEELRINAELQAEEVQQKLYQLQANSKKVQSSGKAQALEEANAKAEQIEAEANLDKAKYRSQARKIENESNLNMEIKRNTVRMEHQQKLADIEIHKAKELAEIESSKFQAMIDALGQETMVALANAGPEAQAELLQGLGLQGYIFTDGNNPINLFNGAQGLIGQAQQQQ